MKSKHRSIRSPIPHIYLDQGMWWTRFSYNRDLDDKAMAYAMQLTKKR